MTKLINRPSENYKKDLNTRVKSVFFIVIFYVLIFVLSIFADIRTGDNGGWVSGLNLPYWASFTFAILLMLSFVWMNYFFAKELNNCFLKFKKNVIIWFLTISFIVIEFTPTLAYLLPMYGIAYYGHGSDPKLLVWITVGLTVSLPLFFAFVFLFLVLKSPNAKKFNIIVFPFISVFLSLFIIWSIYILLCRGPTTFLFLIGIVVFTDMFAYFGGNYFGRHKLCPKISPKKTTEGFVISILITTLLLLFLCYLFSLDPNGSILFNILGFQYLPSNSPPNLNPVWWLGITLLVMFFSLVTTYGDLQFSVFKRVNQLKDFSNLIPGHGGLLDRIDSLSMTVSFYGAISFITSILIVGPQSIFPIN